VPQKVRDLFGPDWSNGCSSAIGAGLQSPNGETFGDSRGNEIFGKIGDQLPQERRELKTVTRSTSGSPHMTSVGAEIFDQEARP
jgi:hypothetical protein